MVETTAIETPVVAYSGEWLAMVAWGDSGKLSYRKGAINFSLRFCVGGKTQVLWNSCLFFSFLFFFNLFLAWVRTVAENFITSSKNENKDLFQFFSFLKLRNTENVLSVSTDFYFISFKKKKLWTTSTTGWFFRWLVEGEDIGFWIWNLFGQRKRTCSNTKSMQGRINLTTNKKMNTKERGSKKRSIEGKEKMNFIDITKGAYYDE